MSSTVSPGPRVSVIIPTYNREEVLLEAVASVQGQTCLDWEIIVVDDGSTDGTRQRLADLAEERLTVVPFEHTGRPGRLRNAGATHASGAYLAFLDSDDLWRPAKLQRQLEVLEESRDASWSFTGFERVDEHGRELARSTPGTTADPRQLAALVLGLQIRLATPTVAVRRDVFMSLGGFDESLSYCEDYDLWIRLALAAEAAPVSESLVVTRYLPDHFASPPLDVGRSWVAVFEKHLRCEDDDLARLARGQYVRFELQVAREYLRRRRVVKAVVSGLKAIRQGPLDPVVWCTIRRGLGLG